MKDSNMTVKWFKDNKEINSKSFRYIFFEQSIFLYYNDSIDIWKCFWFHVEHLLLTVYSKNSKRRVSYEKKVVRSYTLSDQKSFFNQSGHKRCWHRLDIGGPNVPPPISKYFSEIFSPSHIKLTYDNPNMDLKSVQRP